MLKKKRGGAPERKPRPKESAVQLIKAVRQWVKLLSENGSGFVAQPFNAYLKAIGIHHICAQRSHPQTNGKIERSNRTTKEKVLLIVHASPEEFDRAPEAFQLWYNTNITTKASAVCTRQTFVRPRRCDPDTAQTALAK